jgi:hypothetical protein
MQDIISPIDRDLLMEELNEERFVRSTNNGNNEIYIVTHHNSPYVMKEIGRLREVTFRAAGGGTGKDSDIDKYDIADSPYKQLIVWNPEEKELVGGYRFICCKDADRDAEGKLMLATRGLLEFSEKFEMEYLPFTIELGRSFVQPKYQPSVDTRKGLFALDNIWDGLGAIVADHPDMKYLFGKVTMYQHYNRTARDILLYFMHSMFPDKENLITPTEPLPMETDEGFLSKIFTADTYEENFKILVKTIRSYGENIPPLINIYMNLSPTMRTFGTSINKNFGFVEETGIMVTIADIHDSKKNRHLNTYKKNKNANY